MHNLTPLTALGSDTPRVDEFPGITIAENADRALASMAMRHGKKAGFTRGCKAATGMAPPNPGRFETKAAMTIIATGLEQWMVAAPHDSHETLAADVAASLKDNGSVTEQNDGWVWFDLTGDLCAPMFERLCAANMRAMGAGDVTRTAIDHLGCFVLCHKAGTAYSVIGPRSSAQSLHHALVTAVAAAS